MQKTSKKIILIADAKHCKIFEYIGFKIQDLIQAFDFDDLITNHKRESSRDGFSKKDGGQSHFFDPHSNPEELDRKEFAKVIVQNLVHLNDKINISDLIIVAPSKLGSQIKHDFPKSFEKINQRQVHKELVKADKEQIEKIVFSS